MGLKIETKKLFQKLPGGSVARTLHFLRRGPASIHDQGARLSQDAPRGKKKKKLFRVAISIKLRQLNKLVYLHSWVNPHALCYILVSYRSVFAAFRLRSLHQYS